MLHHRTTRNVLILLLSLGLLAGTCKRLHVQIGHEGPVAIKTYAHDTLASRKRLLLASHAIRPPRQPLVPNVTSSKVTVSRSANSPNATSSTPCPPKGASRCGCAAGTPAGHSSNKSAASAQQWHRSDHRQQEKQKRDLGEQGQVAAKQHAAALQKKAVAQMQLVTSPVQATTTRAQQQQYQKLQTQHQHNAVSEKDPFDDLLPKLLQQGTLQPDVLQQMRVLIQQQVIMPDEALDLAPEAVPRLQDSSSSSSQDHGDDDRMLLGIYGGANMEQQTAELESIIMGSAASTPDSTATATEDPVAPPPAAAAPAATTTGGRGGQGGGSYCIPYIRDAPFNVLAVGDSLTQGSVNSINRSIPYTIQLTRRLKHHIGDNANVLDAGLGGGGLFTTGIHHETTFVPWVHSYLDTHAWDLVVMMVGINDLLRGGVPAADIKGILKDLLYDILYRGTPVILIPPLAAPGFVDKDDPKEAQRVALAAAYRQMAEERKQNSRPGEPQIWLLDLQAGPFNFWAMSPEEQQLYLDDGLHLTPFGYIEFGDYVYDEIRKRLCFLK